MVTKTSKSVKEYFEKMQQEVICMEAVPFRLF